MTTSTLVTLLALLSAQPPAEPASATTTTTTAETERAPQRLKVLVLPPHGGGLNDDERNTIAGLIAFELAKQDAFEVASARDIQKMAALEAEKVTLGCNDASCLTDLAGALGAQLIVFGDVGKLGSLLVVNLSLFDSEQSASVGRVSVQTLSIESLPAELSPALDSLVADVLVQEGWRSPAANADVAAVSPPPAAEVDVAGVVLPWGLIGAGALVTTGGIVTDLLLPSSANDVLDGGDLIGPALMGLGLGAAGAGAALLLLEPFEGAD